MHFLQELVIQNSKVLGSLKAKQIESPTPTPSGYLLLCISKLSEGDAGSQNQRAVLTQPFKRRSPGTFSSQPMKPAKGSGLLLPGSRPLGGPRVNHVCHVLPCDTVMLQEVSLRTGEHDEIIVGKSFL